MAGLLLLLAASVASARVAYVTGTDQAASNPYVVPVDLTTETAGSQIPLPSGGEGSAEGVAITPDGKRAYVAAGNTDKVVPIDVATNTAGTPIVVGAGPFGVAITPDGTRVYVTNEFDGTVSVIDTATNAVTATIPVGSFPLGIAITPDGKRAYVANVFDNTVSVIDLTTNTVIATPTGFSSPSGATTTPDGTKAYVSEGGGDTLPIDVATNTVGAPIVGGAGSTIAITPNGNRAYTTDNSSGNSVPLDLAAASAGTPIPISGIPAGIAITPNGTQAFVTTQDNVGSLTPIDVATNTAAPSFPIGNRPEGIAIVPNQGPHAAFSFSPHKPKVKKSVGFDGGASIDSDGSVARYDWDFGDGKSAANAGPTPHHSFAKAGTYKVTLTTTDNEGCSTTMVFAGQTAYCNGSAAARVTHNVKVVAPPACPTAKARGTSFTPHIRPGPTVPGVRVRLATGTPTRFEVTATLSWDGGARSVKLGRLSVKVRHWRRVRFPIPDSLRGRLPVGSRVTVHLRIETHPLGAASSCADVTYRTLHVRVVKVFPNAVQHGRVQ